MKTLNLTVDAVHPMSLRGRTAGFDAGPLLARIGRAFQSLGRSRADAVVATPGDPVREAAAVRAMGSRYQQSDPGFAAELFAAADRHERAGTEG